MDSITTNYHNIVEEKLKEYADFINNDDQVDVELVFDREHNHYLLVEAGWQNGYRIYGTLLHIDIINNKLWIQHDGTEEGIADELVAEGIPKEHIVLAFKSLERRKLTDFAIS
ncbi:MAG TPA: XisI protein [Leptolyngbyaceae cyanobacterium]